MDKVTIRKIGNSGGVILPKKLLSQMKLSEGDTVFVTETKHGFHVSVYDPGFEEQMLAAEKVMGKYKNTLKELAK